MKKIMALLYACVVPAQAAEWYYLSTSGAEASHYLDASSVVRTSDSVDVWIKSVQLFKPSPRTDAWTMTARWRINCVSRTSQSMGATWHDKRGQVLHSSSEAPTSLIRPESAADVWREALCTKFPLAESKLYLKVPNNDVQGFQDTARSIYSEAK